MTEKTLLGRVVKDAEKRVKHDRDNLIRTLLIEMSAFTPSPFAIGLSAVAAHWALTESSSSDR